MAKPVIDPAIGAVAQKVAAEHQPIQFGFTSGGGAGAMKATLFSRMSPNAKGGSNVSAAPANNFAEAAKIARTQGSTGNI